MDANTAYQVAKALPREGQERLFEMLKKDLYSCDLKKKKRRNVLTEEDAIQYLLNNVFNKKD
ncbi:hypothetical protein [Psychroflexus sediminis]|uniref:Uncharacterized protein n=1 Tax=Psychroflexus sediminis TaxID=470826 RepID=A0A1G7U6I1_9FLAO|nr:hypothetical protein [Psychroflexus sediminis]SDG43037.1 hypothetical protein SAMN04488027_101287 [Psychroflexus sediminis]